jgi:hypothetical protein
VFIFRRKKLIDRQPQDCVSQRCAEQQRRRQTLLAVDADKYFRRLVDIDVSRLFHIDISQLVDINFFGFLYIDICEPFDIDFFGFLNVDFFDDDIAGVMKSEVISFASLKIIFQKLFMIVNLK